MKKNEFNFIARTKSKPTKVFRIWSQPYTENGIQMNRLSWAFYVGVILKNGEEEPVYDSWDTEFDVIVQHPPMYTDESLDWFDEDGESVDLQEVSNRV